LERTRDLDVVGRDFDQGVEGTLKVCIDDVGDHRWLMSDPPDRIRAALDE
jgi:hypothetical protein